MEGISGKLEELQKALELQMDCLQRSYKNKQYGKMNKFAENIVKLSYTIKLFEKFAKEL